MVFPDRQKKPIRFLPGWTTQIMFSFIIILAKPPLTHVVIFWLIMCKLLVCLLCSVCWKSTEMGLVTFHK